LGLIAVPKTSEQGVNARVVNGAARNACSNTQMRHRLRAAWNAFRIACRENIAEQARQK